MLFGSPQQMLGLSCVYFEYQRRVPFEGAVADPLQTITAILRGSKWSVLLLRMVMQEAMSEVLSVYPQFEMNVYVDDIKIHVWGENRELPEVTMKVFENLEEAVTKKGRLMLPLCQRAKEGESKMIASCSYPKERLKEDCNTVGVGITDSVEMHRHDFRRRKGTLEQRQKLKHRINIIKDTKARQRQCIGERSEQVVDTVSGPSNDIGRESTGHPPTERLSLRR